MIYEPALPPILDTMVQKTHTLLSAKNMSSVVEKKGTENKQWTLYALVQNHVSWRRVAQQSRLQRRVDVLHSMLGFEQNVEIEEACTTIQRCVLERKAFKKYKRRLYSKVVLGRKQMISVCTRVQDTTKRSSVARAFERSNMPLESFSRLFVP